MTMPHGIFNHGPASRHGRTFLRIAGWTIGGVALAVLFAFLFGIVVKLLWNWLMPPLFGLGTITFWQAFGLVLLAKILFGGHGHGHKEHGFPSKKPFPKRDSGTDGDSVPPPVDGAGWRRFQDFWNAEGKQAYEDYVQRSGGR